MRTPKGPVSLLGSATAAIVVLLFILSYGVYAPGTPEAPRPVTVTFCSPVEITPGMSITGAAMTFGSRNFPIPLTHTAERFALFAAEIGVHPEASVPYHLIEVCISRDRTTITDINVIE